MPTCSTLVRRQTPLKVNIPFRGSAGPPHLLVDSVGIKVESKGEWNARKHGGTKRRVWRKIHIGIDEQTPENRAAAIIPPRENAKPSKHDSVGAIARNEALRA